VTQHQVTFLIKFIKIQNYVNMFSNKAKGTTGNKSTREMENDFIGRLYRLEIYVYIQAIKLTNETKLREFQFKFLNHTVPKK